MSIDSIRLEGTDKSHSKFDTFKEKEKPDAVQDMWN
jgi:hypothetical protein